MCLKVVITRIHNFSTLVALAITDLSADMLAKDAG